MNESAFALGDVVKLRSGGLNMTVVGISKRQNSILIECEWLEATAMGGQAKAHGYFPPAALRKDEQ
ncbi:MAG: DUF2158 domain-containing protein [Pirellulaceae bacterium]